MYDSGLTFHHRLLRGSLHKGGDSQKNGGNDHAGVCHVERWPRVEWGETEVETKEIDHVAIEESASEENAIIMGAEQAVSEVSKNARDDQSHCRAAEFARKEARAATPDQEGQRAQGNEGESIVGILRAIEHPEGDAGVGGMVQPKGAFDQLILTPVEVEVRHNPAL